jgi:hypothetical protein
LIGRGQREERANRLAAHVVAHDDDGDLHLWMRRLSTRSVARAEPRRRTASPSGRNPVPHTSPAVVSGHSADSARSGAAPVLSCSVRWMTSNTMTAAPALPVQLAQDPVIVALGIDVKKVEAMTWFRASTSPSVAYLRPARRCGGKAPFEMGEDVLPIEKASCSHQVAARLPPGSSKRSRRATPGSAMATFSNESGSAPTAGARSSVGGDRRQVGTGSMKKASPSWVAANEQVQRVLHPVVRGPGRSRRPPHAQGGPDVLGLRRQRTVPVPPLPRVHNRPQIRARSGVARPAPMGISAPSRLVCRRCSTSAR